MSNSKESVLSSKVWADDGSNVGAPSVNPMTSGVGSSVAEDDVWGMIMGDLNENERGKSVYGLQFGYPVVLS